ncbi:MAG: NADH-quinone oxidoreductase subunit J [Anaerolineae bacterium]|nr:NADH-quinone oxidoreductase subunit J [Anaerolineae bacterium]
MSVGTVIFLVVAAVAILAAIGMLLSENAIHSALFLILNLACVAFFYQMLNAPFMAMVQITVYAGAIMVLFLFVIMLLGAERLRTPHGRFAWQVPVAFVLAVVFVVTVVVAVLGGGLRDMPPPPAMTEVEAAAYGGPEQIGEALFTRYVLPFEMVAVLLLASMIGAVVLSREEGFSISRGERLQRARGRRDALSLHHRRQEDLETEDVAGDLTPTR